MNFQKFLTTKPLARNHPFLLQNALKLTYSKVKTKKIFQGTPASGEETGEKEEGKSEWKERVLAPHFFIQVFAYGDTYSSLQAGARQPCRSSEWWSYSVIPSSTPNINVDALYFLKHLLRLCVGFYRIYDCQNILTLTHYRVTEKRIFCEAVE